MSKVSLKVDPTFWLPVKFGKPGGGHITIEFEFIYRTVKEFDAWRDEMRQRVETGMDGTDQVLEMARDWRGPDVEFSKQAIEELLDKFHAAGRLIGEAYASELTQARLGN